MMKRIIHVLLVVAVAAISPWCAVHGQQAPGQRFALVIGISGYPNFPKNERLSFTDDDARLFHATLQRPECGGFLPANTILLINKEATRVGILNAITSLQRMTGPNDLIYFFFAGHGVQSPEGVAYLMPYDAEHDLPENLGFEIADFISGLRSKLNYKHLVCFIDACHSGAALHDMFMRSGRQNISPDVKQAIIGDSTSTTMGFLSCSASQNSWEDPELEHGLFTWFLVEGMKGAADEQSIGDRNGRVTANELFQFIYDNVSTVSARKYSRQIPDRAGLNPDFTFGEKNPKDIKVPDKGVRFPPNPAVIMVAWQFVFNGSQLLNNDEVEAAVKKFREAIELYPEFVMAHYDLGVALMRARDFSGAEEAFRAAIELDPRYANAHCGLGAILLNRRNITGAVDELMTATGLASREPEAHYYLSIALALDGDLDGAQDAMETYALLSVDTERMGAAARALELIRRNAEYLREGRRLMQEGEADDALQQFYNMVRLDPGSAIAYYEIGRIHYSDEAWARAATNLNYAIRLNWEITEAHYLLGSTYDHLNKSAEALEQYRAYLELAPGGELSQMTRSRIEVLESTADTQRE